jgi:hypothetical protein
VHKSRLTLRSSILLCAVLGWSTRFAHAAPGQTPLPKDESSIEQDLDEDDHSFTPLDTEKLKSTDSPSSDVPVEPTAPPAAVTETPPPPETAPPPERPPTTVIQSDPEDTSHLGKSEKIFDWSKHENETSVKHPFYEKGLIRIDKDRNYYYKVDETEQKHAFSIHVGTIEFADLSNPDTPDSPYRSFDSNYEDSSNPQIIFEYEWQAWRTPIGKFGFRVGSGIFVAQGHGHFVHNYSESKGIVTPRETFTFLMMPNTFGVVYRLHMFHKQLFVPYAEGGGVAYTFSEVRDDGVNPKFGGAFGAYGAAGVAINLTYFDYMTRIQLDREYGINACYLALEFRRFQALTTRYDFSSNYINGGFLMEY